MTYVSEQRLLFFENFQKDSAGARNLATSKHVTHYGQQMSTGFLYYRGVYLYGLSVFCTNLEVNLRIMDVRFPHWFRKKNDGNNFFLFFTGIFTQNNFLMQGQHYGRIEKNYKKTIYCKSDGQYL